ncbi:MAG: hypothetical protein FWC16_10245 [Defluviitaleaceae bacterium]|nr:hypothetical protein [Defluviitaleaceae bacterium]MCL2275296.1 hypothetical protein [Defluviitaleaceae bacterium]
MDKSKPMMIIIIALLVLLLGTVVAVTIFLITSFGNDGTINEQGPMVTPSPILAPGDIYWRELEEIRTNLLDGPNRPAHIIVSLMVGTNNSSGVPRAEAQALELAFNFQRARTIANEVLFATTYTEAKSPEGRAAIEERILTRLQLEYGHLIVAVSSNEWIVN